MTQQSLAGPVAETTLGRFRGTTQGAACIFRGIRYGTAARFRPPVAPEPFAGIRDATTNGPSAPQHLAESQTDAFLSWYSRIEPTSEACQVLNVFTPGCDSGRRPVMVWLHGGGWMNLSSTAPGTDGTALATAEDVVVVTLNHRLGAFGFLALGARDERFADAGNAGLLDIVLALEFVRDNAAAFGGDAGNVTIFGQSGGAAKVAALMEMKAAEGLFHKAIIQSLSGGLQIAERDEADRMAAAVFREAGTQDPAELAAMPADRFLAVQTALPRTFRPVIDDRQFTRHPFMPDAPVRSRHIPLLAGCTETESSYYLRHDPGNFRIGARSLLRRLQRFLGTESDATRRIVEAYGDHMPGTSPSDILIAVTTDQIFKRNTYHAARAQGMAGASAHAFVFARETPVQGGRLRAPHCSEVPFVFGTTEVAAAHVGTGPDIVPMTRQMMATWATFARNGSPGNNLLPDWRSYSEFDRPVMSLKPAPELVPAPGEAARAALDPLPRLEYSVDRTSFVTD